jgi:hypothetical protein
MLLEGGTVFPKYTSFCEMAQEIVENANDMRSTNALACFQQILLMETPLLPGGLDRVIGSTDPSLIFIVRKENSYIEGTGKH